QAGDPLSLQPGCIRDQYFDQVFPTGLLIGDQGGLFDGDLFYAALFTDAEAIEIFLPGGGKPRRLTFDLINPVTTPAGVVASQLIALKLNREFSCAGIFTLLVPEIINNCYGVFIIPAECGKFAGITVDQFIVIADAVVSGDLTPADSFGATASDVNFTATCLNELFNNNCFEEPITSPIISSGLDKTEAAIPTVFSLAQNYPNPFNPETKISFGLPEAADVSIIIYNVLGQQVTTVTDGYYTAGFHTVSWNGLNVSSGVYFYSMRANGVVIKSQKMVLLK
ncbi:MAG: T9SS type A sorting domain-containing protein, partial [candidate division Zixibacteria bacterium]|nr:T9SS type A sorting domain-containing protein [candidate division Zixibacteria bacterium]